MVCENSKELVAKVMKENIEYRLVSKKHDELENKLRKIDKISFLSSEQEIERKKVQKLKLAAKDKMAQILSKFKNKG